MNVFVKPSSSAISSKVLPDCSFALSSRSASSPIFGPAATRTDAARMVAAGAHAEAVDVSSKDRENKGAMI